MGVAEETVNHTDMENDASGLDATGQLGHRCWTIRIVGVCSIAYFGATTWLLLENLHRGYYQLQRLLLTCDNDDSGRDAHAENVVHNGVDWVHMPSVLGLSLA